MHMPNFWLINPTSLQGKKRIITTITFGQLISVLQHYYHKKKNDISSFLSMSHNLTCVPLSTLFAC
jgi:hypothetical protein